MGIDIDEIRVSKICTDKNYGVWFAVGTQKEWFEFRVTRGGKIKVFTVHKGKHPYFTLAKEG